MSILKTIRSRIAAAMTVSAVVGIASSAFLLWSGLSERSTAHMALVHSQARAAIVEAAFAMSLERSVSQVSLGLPAAEPLRLMLEEQRRKTDSAIAAVRSRIYAIGPKEASSLLALAAVQDMLGNLRRQIDAQVAGPRSDVADTISSLKENVLALARLGEAMRHGSTSEPIYLAERTQNLAWEIREFAGRERTHIVIATATESQISPATAAEATVYGHRAADAFARLRSLLKDEPRDSPLRMAARTVETGQFGSQAQVRAAMFAAGREQMPSYPMRFEEYFRTSGIALAEVEQLADTAAAESVRLWQEKMDSAGASTAVAILVLTSLLGAITAMTSVVRAMRRLDEIRDSLHKVANGNLDTAVPFQGLRDETGMMADGIERLRQASIEARQTAAREIEAERLQAARAASVAKATDRFGNRSTKTVEALGFARLSLDSSVAVLAKASLDAAHAAELLAEEARASANALQETASTADEIAAQAASGGQMALQARHLVREAATEATRLNEATKGLSEASEEIATAISLISDIAAKTNLLALNATIEASRAGNAGKGFSVVAHDVKRLATQTVEVAQTIEARVKAVQAAGTQTAAAVVSIEKAVTRSEQTVQEISDTAAAQARRTRNAAERIRTVGASALTLAQDAARMAEEARKVEHTSKDVATASRLVQDGERSIRDATDELRAHLSTS